MVKIFRCHNFRAQTILPVSSEPVCFSSGGGKVFIGNRDCCVDVYELKGENEWIQYASFQTGAPVSQIEFNDFGDYIVCLEKKTSKRAEVVSVKVYLNWNIAHATKDKYRTRVRVAGLGYRSTDVEIGKRLEVVDIPSEETVKFLTSCQQTGNLAIGAGRVIKLYQMVEKTIPNSSTSYHDMMLFLSLSFDIPVAKFSLCEDYAASACSEYVQVFHLQLSHDRTGAGVYDNLQDDHISPGKRRSSSAVSSSLTPRIDTQRLSSKFVETDNGKLTKENVKFSLVGDRTVSTPSPSFTSDRQVPNSVIEQDDEFVEWTFPSNLNRDQSLVQNRHQSSATIPHDTTLHLNGLQCFTSKRTSEPDMPVLKDLRGGNHISTGKATLTQLMYCYMDESDLSWIHLQLIPTYLKEKTILNVQDNPLHSRRYSDLAGLACLMSGARVGYMYTLMPRPSLLSTYKYSSDALQMACNGRLLFVLVENGLETYTARPCIAALHNSQTFDNSKQACPLPETDICMCGVQQFLGVKDVTIIDNFVILHTNINEASQTNVWNVYGLEDSRPADLYHDMVQFGSKYQEKAVDTYHHLLLEAHMVLRSNLIDLELSQSERMSIQDLLHESCALLGEYYAIPGNEDWYLCLPYYTMSGLGLTDIIRQIQQFKQHSLKNFEVCGEGFVHFLKHVLFLNEDPLDIKQADCDSIMEICAASFPDKLAELVMMSRIRNFTPKKILKLLQSRSKRQQVQDPRAVCLDVLAMISLNLSMCETEGAISLLAAIDKVMLQRVCTEYHPILHTGFTEFSPLAQFLRCHCPGILIQILVSLFDRDVMSVDLAIQLLKGRSGIPEVHRNTQVRDYLETLVGSESRKVCFEKAVGVLCEIYLARLKEWEAPSSRQISTSMKLCLPIGTGHFGHRHLWLDNIKPLLGSKAISGPCLYVVTTQGTRAGKYLQCQKINTTCSCFLCNEDLLKLQSLLCYPEAGVSLYEHVLRGVRGYEDRQFYPSVYLLCELVLDMEKAIDHVVSHHIHIAPQFGSSIIKHRIDKWKAMLQKLLSYNQEIQTSGIKDIVERGRVLKFLKESVLEMTRSIQPEDFVRILPDDGNFFFFMPFVKHCMQNVNRHDQKERIQILGGTLGH